VKSNKVRVMYNIDRKTVENVKAEHKRTMAPMSGIVERAINECLDRQNRTK